MLLLRFSTMPTPATKRELGIPELTSSMHLTLLEPKCLLILLSYTKLHWAIVLKPKNGDHFWLNISNDKENHHMLIMRNIWHILLLRAI